MFQDLFNQTIGTIVGIKKADMQKDEYNNNQLSKANKAEQMQISAALQKKSYDELSQKLANQQAVQNALMERINLLQNRKPTTDEAVAALSEQGLLSNRRRKEILYKSRGGAY